MKTDALIEHLSQNVEPVRGGMARRRLLLGLAAGSAVSFALMAFWLGVRPDLMSAMGTAAYWMKFFYTLLFAISGFWSS